MTKIFTIVIFFSDLLLVGQNNSVFNKDIAHYSNGKPIIYYTTIRQYEKTLKLDTIENGFDSLQIRIWYHYPKFRPPKNIFILKRQNSTWITSVYNYDGDTLKSISPKTSVQKVVNKILSKGILTLPDMHDIKGLEDNYVDGESYTIEISSQKQYRLYNYHVPEHFKRKFKEPKKIVKILKLLKKEFNIPLAHWD